MQVFAKSIEKLLHKQKKNPRRKHISNPRINGTYSEYVEEGLQDKQRKLKSYNYLKEHDQKLQNKRLLRKLEQIKGRSNTHDRSADEEKTIENVYRLNMASRALQRQLRQKQLNEDNKKFINRIVSIRVSPSPLAADSRTPTMGLLRKRSNKSGFLPALSDSHIN